MTEPWVDVHVVGAANGVDLALKTELHTVGASEASQAS